MVQSTDVQRVLGRSPNGPSESPAPAGVQELRQRGRAARRRLTAMHLVRPSRDYLAGYVDALERG